MQYMHTYTPALYKQCYNTFFLVCRHGGSVIRIPNDGNVDKRGGVLEGVESFVSSHTLHGRVVDFENLISRLQAAIFVGWATRNDLLDVDTIEEGVGASCDNQTEHLVTFEDDKLTFL